MTFRVRTFQTFAVPGPTERSISLSEDTESVRISERWPGRATDVERVGSGSVAGAFCLGTGLGIVYWAREFESRDIRS